MTVGRVELVGPLGVGKTTLLKRVATVWRGAFVFEDLTPIARMIDWRRQRECGRTFALQAAFYLNSLRQLVDAAAPGEVVVADYSLAFHHHGYSAYLCEIGALSPEEFALLASLHERLTASLPPVVALILCSATPRTILSRVAARGRSGETAPPQLVDFLLNRVETLGKKACVPTLSVRDDGAAMDAHAEELAEFLDGIASRHRSSPSGDDS